MLWHSHTTVLSYTTILQHTKLLSCVFLGECCAVEAVRHLHPVILRCLQDSPRSWAAPWCHKLCAGWRSCLRENNYQVSSPRWHQLHRQHKVSLAQLHQQHKVSLDQLHQQHKVSLDQLHRQHKVSPDQNQWYSSDGSEVIYVQTLIGNHPREQNICWSLILSAILSTDSIWFCLLILCWHCLPSVQDIPPSVAGRGWEHPNLPQLPPTHWRWVGHVIIWLTH